MSTLSERGVQTNRVPSDADFGTRLAMVRQHKSWNTARAARECGVAEATWRTWEEGSRPRDYEKVCRSIADTAEVDLIWLLTGQTIPEPVISDPINGDAERSAQNLKDKITRAPLPAARLAA